MWLWVENDSKFVRRKGRAREEIERRVLSRYSQSLQYGEPRQKTWRVFAFDPYTTDEELDRIIYNEI
jgi:hypothetical protein